jgi:uncharacterized protein YbjQ (UPF0145 family)
LQSPKQSPVLLGHPIPITREENPMIITTTPSVEGRRIVAYHGIVTGESILGANFVRDFFASIRDVVGGRSGSYEKVMRSARDTALDEMADEARRKGANAVVGVDLDYGSLGTGESMMMVTASGTAVTLG